MAQRTVIAMHRRAGELKYQRPRDRITKIAASSFPQALTGPAREKISSGDDYGSHTHWNKDFQISCLAAYYYCYSLFTKRWQKAKYNKQKNRKLRSSRPRNLWLVLHSVPPGCKSRLFFPPLPFQQNKWTGWTACDICMIGGDHLNRLSSQSLNSLRAAKSSSWQSPLKTLAVLIAALEVTTSITKWISNDKQAL